MSEDLIVNDVYTLTRFCREKNKKLGYRITQRTHGDLMFDYVVLRKKDLKNILEAIERDE